MNNIVFYQPPSASGSQPPRLLGALPSSNVSRASMASLSVCQTTSQLNQRNRISKDHVTKSQDAGDLSQQRHFLDQCFRNDPIQEQENLTVIRNSPDSDDDDDLPEIDELFSGMVQKNDSVCAGPNSDDDDGFVNIDELLSSMKQENISASAKPNSDGMAKKVDSRTCDGSPTDSTRSTEGSGQDPIILSDDESVGAESETDYNNLDVDLRAKSDSDSTHVTEREPADDGGFGSRTTHTSGRLVANHTDDGNNNGVADDTQLQLPADRPGSASPSHRTVTQHASKLRVNTEITQGSARYVDLDVTKEVDNDDADTRSTKRSRSSAVSRNNPASDSNISVSKRQDSQHDSAQSQQLGPAGASLQQSDLINDPLPRHLRRRDTTRNIHRKRPCTTAPTRLASAASTVSAALESTDLGEPQSRALITAPDQEMVDGGSIDDSNDEDYRDMGDAAGSKIGSRLRSWKRIRRVKNMEDTDVEVASTHPPDVSCQAIAATSPGGMQESEEIPMHGYFTLKTIASKVVYCLTFSQELLPHPQDPEQREDSTTDLGEPQSVAPVTDPNHQWGICKIIDRKVVNDEKHYKVKWEDTWMPEFELADVRELIDEFEAKLRRAQGGSREGRQKWPKTEDHLVIGRSEARGEKVTKKPRGRPRKQK